MTSAERSGGGVALVIAACACFAALDTGSKYISAAVPMMMVLWFRYVIQMLFIGIVVVPRQGGAPFDTRHPVLQVVRGLLLLLCSVLAFTSLTFMPVGEFTAIVMISPLVVTFLSAVALKERVSLLRWLPVVGGFIGALIVIRPGGESFDWAMLLPLALVGANACFQILTSKLSKTDAAGTTHFITGLVGLAVTTLVLPLFWRAPDGAFLWVLLVALGFLGAVGHYFLILGYSRAPASSLTPYLYSHIAFATLGGALVFAHLPDRWSLLGIAVITVCGIAGLWVMAREARA
ncbi:MAG: DMT family transporter [Burkholderiales bacterium]|nr:DMT family transporter [Burkholderiales bacterium]